MVPIDRSNWRAALSVRVSDEQLPMVADHQPIALVILAKAHVQPDDRRWEPLAYVDGSGAIVAVLALAHGESRSEIVNLAVDLEHQRTGVGTEAVEAAAGRCRDLGAHFVELTVAPQNEVASRLYQRVGFVRTGDVRNDEPVWELRLTDTSDASDTPDGP